ncbi:MAG: pyridoxamine 5'-phosphate oxidase family protein [Desulfosarcinaceae bacterium]|nr:pyridoxamine 5'-phosphate oxidase family protein [Desulfosarcinaceae bacterium]
MTKREMIDFIRRHPACSVATCQGDQPRARIIMTYRADADGILFMTGREKAFNRQLLANPKVELCYYDPEGVRTLRISGQVAMVSDDALKAEIVEAFNFLKPVAEEQGLEVFTVWRLSEGQALCWDAKTPFAPMEVQTF